MRRTTMLLFVMAAGQVHAEALNKFSVPLSQPARATPPVEQRAATPDASRLQARQKSALEAMRRQSPAVQKQWLAAFRKQERDAAAQGNFEAAYYYRGIIEAYAKGAR